MRPSSRSCRFSLDGSLLDHPIEADGGARRRDPLELAGIVGDDPAAIDVGLGVAAVARHHEARLLVDLADLEGGLLQPVDDGVEQHVRRLLDHRAAARRRRAGRREVADLGAGPPGRRRGGAAGGACEAQPPRPRAIRAKPTAPRRGAWPLPMDRIWVIRVVASEPSALAWAPLRWSLVGPCWRRQPRSTAPPRPMPVASARARAGASGQLAAASGAAVGRMIHRKAAPG